MMESRWGVKDSGVITDAITIKLRQSRQAQRWMELKVSHRVVQEVRYPGR